MKTEEFNTQETVGTKTIIVKRRMFHKYMDSQKKTPPKIINEQKGRDEDPMCVILGDAYNLVEILWFNYTYQFYANKKVFLLEAEKKMAELSSYFTESSASDLISQISRPASQLVSEMEESQKPILCIDEATANMACMLVFARVQTELTKKHEQDLPNGAELLMKADEHFEELCSSLHIPRRTRSIINKKKNATLE